MDREIVSLRNDFQNLESLFHSSVQSLEKEIEALTDEIKKYAKGNKL